MDNAVSLGLYTSSGKGCESILPVPHEGGLWQVWKMPDGSFMIQPLGSDKDPVGSAVAVSGESVYKALTPLPTLEALEDSSPPPAAASPDLLTYWYQQAQAEHPASPEKIPSSQHTRSGLTSNEEVLFTAAWFPGETPGEPFSFNSPPWEHLPETPSSTPPPAFPGVAAPKTRGIDFPLTSRGPADAGRGMPPFPEEAAHPRQQEKNAATGTDLSLPPLQAFMAANRLFDKDEREEDATVPGNADAEERALRLENTMRAEFTALADQLDGSAYPAVEADLERLIKQRSGFTWRQKFMFTEFGLSLRRKHRAVLALQCHRRALELSPSDEHVLFNIARMEYELGDTESAKEHLRAALASAPDFDAAGNFLNFLSGTS